MTDGNTHLDEREDWDALQEVTAELEQAEARIAELELAVKYEADLAQMALDSRKELEANLAGAVKLIDLAVELTKWDLNPKLRDDMIDFTTELKGQDDE